MKKDPGPFAVSPYFPRLPKVELVPGLSLCPRRLPRANQIRIGKSFVFLVDDFPEFCGGKSSTATALKGTPVSIHHYVENCDAAIKRAQDAGATVTMPAADMFWGDRYGVVTDPYGHKWSFATHIKDLTPDESRAAMKDAFAQRT